MVATAPREKNLVIGRRAVRNWTQLQFFLCFTGKRWYDIKLDFVQITPPYVGGVAQW